MKTISSRMRTPVFWRLRAAPRPRYRSGEACFAKVIPMDDREYGPVTARYYDAAYAALGTLGPDVEFYRQLARQAAGPVLEIGCGTGRVLQPIAEDGLPCSGLDLSAEMLDVLRAKVAPDVALVRADMRSFDLVS